jgi:hypothetical protein
MLVYFGVIMSKGFAVGLALLVATQGVFADSFRFRQTMKGLSAPAAIAEPSPPSEEVWTAFAKNHGLSLDSTWNSVQWNASGLDGLPDAGFPNPNPTGNVRLTNQAITSLGSSFSTTKTVGGSLNFYGTPLASLEGFNALTTVNGNVALQHADLATLQGLESLVTIGGHVF